MGGGVRRVVLLSEAISLCLLCTQNLKEMDAHYLSPIKDKKKQVRTEIHHIRLRQSQKPETGRPNKYDHVEVVALEDNEGDADVES